MTRLSKQEKKRTACPRKLKASFSKKTGPKEDNLKQGYRVHESAIGSKTVFIPKVK